MAIDTPSGTRRWEVIYPLYSCRPVGTEVLYEQAESLGVDLRSDRTPIYRVISELEAREGRTLINIPGVGYRVAHAHEHVKLSKRRERRAAKQIRKAIATANATRREELTPEQLRELDETTMSLCAKDNMNRMQGASWQQAMRRLGREGA